MPPIDSLDLAYGIPLIVIIPAMIEIAKRNGLATRLAGPAAILTAIVLLALGDLALANTDETQGQRIATWIVGGIVYGLAASGFYSLTPNTPTGMLRSEDRSRSTFDRSTP